MFGNLGGMVSQIQGMQESLKELQIEVAVREGAVSVCMNGAQNLMAVKISPELIQGDVTVLEDSVIEALALAQQESRNKVQEQVASMTGLNIANFASMFKG